MDKNKFFWIGAGGSGAIYAFLIVVVLFTATRSPKRVQISGQNIAIDMIMSESAAESQKPQSVSSPTITPPPPQTKEDTVAIKPEPIQKPIEVKPTLDDAKNILKSFSTKPAEIKPKPETPSQSQSAKSILSSLTLKKNAPSVTFSSSGANSNEYLGKIAGIIKAAWQPYKTDAGLTAIISINIKSNGSFDFTIKRASPNTDFNERLNAYLQELKSKGFPPPDDKKSVSVDFNFIAKE